MAALPVPKTIYNTRKLEDLVLSFVLKRLGEKFGPRGEELATEKEINELSDLRSYLRLTQKIQTDISFQLRYFHDRDWMNNKNRWLLFENEHSTKHEFEEIFRSTDETASEQYQFMILKRLQSSKVPFYYLTKLLLGSSLSNKSTGSFHYESKDKDLKDLLIDVLSNAPNLAQLTIKSFCDDEILAEIIAKKCPKLQVLKIELTPMLCPNKNRLTDEGFIDFIEDTKAKETITKLDVSHAFCNISLRSVGLMYKFSKLVELHINLDMLSHLQWDPKPPQNLSVRKLSITFIDIISNDQLRLLDGMFPKVASLRFDPFSIPSLNPLKISSCKDLFKNWTKSITCFHGACLNFDHLVNLVKVFPALIVISVYTETNYVISDETPISKKIRYIQIRTGDSYSMDITNLDEAFQTIFPSIVEVLTRKKLKRSTRWYTETRSRLRGFTPDFCIDDKNYAGGFEEVGFPNFFFK